MRRNHRTGALLLVCAVSLAVTAGCRRQEPDPRLPILEEQARMLMIAEAQDGFSKLFKARFDASKTRLLLAADLTSWMQQRKKSLEALPQQMKDAIAESHGAGLLIQDGLPGTKGGTQDVVYMRAPRFGNHRLFVRGEVDPCGDGNPAMCEFCSGCEGESSPGGTIQTCVCTMGCDSCRPCPTCSQ